MACIEVQQSIATFLPFVAVNTTDGSPRSGIIFSEIDVAYKKSSQASFSVKSLTAPDFRENGNGVYEILFDTSDLDTTGSFIYVVNGNGGLAAPTIRQYLGQALVVSATAYTPGSVALSTNVLTGNLLDLQGNALVGESVSARVLESPSIQGALAPNIAGVGTDMVSAKTDQSGFFALELLQGAVVDIVIPIANYRRTLTVPGNTTDVLFDLP
jgi:hypothetical protein